MERSASIIELAKALSKFQGAMKSVAKGSVNPYFKSKYADLDAVWDACRKALSENSLALAQATVNDGKFWLETLLLHASGEYLSSRYPLTPMRQVQGQGWIESNDPQSIGSAITYARRYAMSAMLGISADEDDDAEKATQMEGSTETKTTTTIAASRGFCPIHKVPFVERPGGTSKTTGRPYPAFWACPNKVGRGYCQEKPQSPQQAALVVPTEEDLGYGGEGGIVEPETLPWDTTPPHQKATDGASEPVSVPVGGSLPPFPIRGQRELPVTYYLKVAKERYGLEQKEALARIGGGWLAWVDGGPGGPEDAKQRAEDALQRALKRLGE